MTPAFFHMHRATERNMSAKPTGGPRTSRAIVSPYSIIRENKQGQVKEYKTQTDIVGEGK